MSENLSLKEKLYLRANDFRGNEAERRAFEAQYLRMCARDGEIPRPIVRPTPIPPKVSHRQRFRRTSFSRTSIDPTIRMPWETPIPRAPSPTLAEIRSQMYAEAITDILKAVFEVLSKPPRRRR